MRQQKAHWTPVYNKPRRNRRSSDQDSWSSIMVSLLKILASSLLLIMLGLFAGIVLYVALL